jgi:hypothetical protein
VSKKTGCTGKRAWKIPIFVIRQLRRIGWCWFIKLSSINLLVSIPKHKLSVKNRGKWSLNRGSLPEIKLKGFGLSPEGHQQVIPTWFLNTMQVCPAPSHFHKKRFQGFGRPQFYNLRRCFVRNKQALEHQYQLAREAVTERMKTQELYLHH